MLPTAQRDSLRRGVGRRRPGCDRDPKVSGGTVPPTYIGLAGGVRLTYAEFEPPYERPGASHDAPGGDRMVAG